MASNTTDLPTLPPERNFRMNERHLSQILGTHLLPRKNGQPASLYDIESHVIVLQFCNGAFAKDCRAYIPKLHNFVQHANGEGTFEVIFLPYNFPDRLTFETVMEIVPDDWILMTVDFCPQIEANIRRIIKKYKIKPAEKALATIVLQSKKVLTSFAHLQIHHKPGRRSARLFASWREKSWLRKQAKAPSSSDENGDEDKRPTNFDNYPLYPTIMPKKHIKNRDKTEILHPDSIQEKMIGLFFCNARDQDPCLTFAARLHKFAKTVRKSDEDMDIVFYDAHSFNQSVHDAFVREMPSDWWIMPRSVEGNVIKRKFGLRGFPILVIYKDKITISITAYKDVEDHVKLNTAIELFEYWKRVYAKVKKHLKHKLSDYSA